MHIFNSQQAFFPIETRLTGPFDTALRFIEDTQLLDEGLWALFVKQFADKTDSAEGSWRGEFFGKMMRGACMTYSYTKNPKLYRVLEAAVKNLLDTQDELGRITTYTIETEFSTGEKGGWDMWVRKYVLVGLEFFHDICVDNIFKKQIIGAMESHADYILSKIGNGDGKKEITATSTAWGGLASSSVIEPMVKLYKQTGEKRYLDFAEYIAATGFIKDGNLIEYALENVLYPYQYPYPKAYEMMSCFEGLFELYTVTGNEKYCTAVENFISKVAEGEMTVIGGLDAHYEQFSNAAVTQTDTPNEQIHMQETCVCVTWMRLCHKLLLTTGNPMYADYIEKTLYNCFYGAINFERNDTTDILGDIIPNGFPFDSYSPLNNARRSVIAGGCLSIGGGRKYGCCAAIGSAGTALPPLFSAVKPAGGGIAVNLYYNGNAIFDTPQNKKAEIIISGDYETEGKVSITVRCKSEKFPVLLRVPDWTKKAEINVNDDKALIFTSAGYAKLDREWKDGDIIIISFECGVKALMLNELIAVTKGPFVLVREERFGNISGTFTPDIDSNNNIAYESLGACKFPYRIGINAKQIDGPDVPLIDYASAGRYAMKKKNKIRVWILNKDKKKILKGKIIYD